MTWLANAKEEEGSSQITAFRIRQSKQTGNTTHHYGTGLADPTTSQSLSLWLQGAHLPRSTAKEREEQKKQKVQIK